MTSPSMPSLHMKIQKYKNVAPADRGRRDVAGSWWAVQLEAAIANRSIGGRGLDD